MIYVFDDINSFNSEMLEKATRQVSEQRRQYAAKYHFERDRKLCIIAYRLLQIALKREYNIAEEPEFAFYSNGKPYLQKYPSINFSLSHCNNAVACALSDNEIGIDVEDIQPYNADMIDFCCNDAEKSHINNASDPELEFTLLWTQKESAIKLNGATGSNDLANILTNSDNYFMTFDGIGYVGAVCSSCTITEKPVKVSVGQLLPTNTI